MSKENKPLARVMAGRQPKANGESVREPDPRSNKAHLICPCCGNNPEYLGRGKRKWQRQINGPLQQRCYKCDTCGTEWVAEVRAEVEDDVEYRTTSTIQIRPTEEGEKASNESVAPIQESGS